MPPPVCSSEKHAVNLSEGSREVTRKVLFTGFFTASRFRMTGGFRFAILRAATQGGPYVVRKNSRRFISHFRGKFHSAPSFFLSDLKPFHWASNWCFLREAVGAALRGRPGGTPHPALRATFPSRGKAFAVPFFTIHYSLFTNKKLPDRNRRAFLRFRTQTARLLRRSPG